MRGVTVIYGMTETSPLSTQSTPDDSLENRVSTVGQVHPHVEIKIIDPETGAVVPRGVAGLLAGLLRIMGDAISMTCSAATSTILLSTSGRSSKAGNSPLSPSTGLPAFSKKISYSPPASGLAVSCPPPRPRSCGHAGCTLARRGASLRSPARSPGRLGTRTLLRARRRTRPPSVGHEAAAPRQGAW